MKRQLILGLSIGWLTVLGGCKAKVDSSRAGKLEGEMKMGLLFGEVPFNKGDWKGRYLNGLTWNPTGTKLASCGDVVRVWDPGGDLLLTINTDFKNPDPDRWRGAPFVAVSAVAWSPDGTKLVTESYGGSVQVWDSESGKELHTLEASGRAVWSPDGTKLATGGYGGSVVRVWDSESGKELHTLEGRRFQAVHWSFDGTKLVTVSVLSDSGERLKAIRVWDVEVGEELYKFGGFSRGSPRSERELACWSPDGTKLAGAIGDKTVKVWDASTGESLRVLRGHEGYLTGISWSPDGSKLASISWDKTVRVWDATNGDGLHTFEVGYYGQGIVARWNPDGTRLAISVNNRELFKSALTVWDVEHSLALHKFGYEFDCVSNVGWSPDGTKLAISTGESRSGYHGFEIWAFSQ